MGGRGGWIAGGRGGGAVGRLGGLDGGRRDRRAAGRRGRRAGSRSAGWARRRRGGHPGAGQRARVGGLAGLDGAVIVSHAGRSTPFVRVVRMTTSEYASSMVFVASWNAPSAGTSPGSGISALSAMSRTTT